MVKETTGRQPVNRESSERDADPKSVSDASLPEVDAADVGGPTVVETPEGKMRGDAVKSRRNSDLRSGSAAERHEVRAGPGDAGAQDAPEILPKTPKTPKANFARILLWFFVPLAVLMALYWAFST